MRPVTSVVRFGLFYAALRRRFRRAGLVVVTGGHPTATAAVSHATAHAATRGEKDQKDCKTILEGNTMEILGAPY